MNKLFEQFSLQDVIKEQVQRESWIEWAKKQTPEFKIIPGLQVTERVPYTLMRHLLYQWLP